MHLRPKQYRPSTHQQSRSTLVSSSNNGAAPITQARSFEMSFPSDARTSPAPGKTPYSVAEIARQFAVHQQQSGGASRGHLVRGKPSLAPRASTASNTSRTISEIPPPPQASSSSRITRDEGDPTTSSTAIAGRLRPSHGSRRGNSTSRQAATPQSASSWFTESGGGFESIAVADSVLPTGVVDYPQPSEGSSTSTPTSMEERLVDVRHSFSERQPRPSTVQAMDQERDQHRVQLDKVWRRNAVLEARVVELAAELELQSRITTVTTKESDNRRQLASEEMSQWTELISEAHSELAKKLASAGKSELRPVRDSDLLKALQEAEAKLTALERRYRLGDDQRHIPFTAGCRIVPHSAAPSVGQRPGHGHDVRHAAPPSQSSTISGQPAHHMIRPINRPTVVN